MDLWFQNSWKIGIAIACIVMIAFYCSGLYRLVRHGDRTGLRDLLYVGAPAFVILVGAIIYGATTLGFSR